MNIQRIRKIAEIFRLAIDEASEYGELKGYMRSFPKGCCDYVSEFFMKYLRECYNFDVIQVRGKRGYGWDGDSHTWLETENGILIDLTGDQYNNRQDDMFYDVRVYVGRGDSFHDKFEMDQEYDTYDDIPEYDVHSDDKRLREKSQSYYAIIERIKL